MARYEEHPVKPTTAVIVLVLSFLFLYCPWLLGSKELYWEEVNYAIQAVENTWFPPLSIEQAVAVANGFPLYPLMARLLYELGIPMELALRLLSIASLGILATMVYLTTVRIGGTMAGATATVTLLASNIVIEKALNGYPNMLMLLLLTAGQLSWFTLGARRGNWSAAWLAGFGFTALAFYVGGFMAIVYFIFPLIFLRRPLSVSTKLNRPGFYLGLVLLALVILFWKLPILLYDGNVQSDPFWLALPTVGQYLYHLCFFPLDVIVRFLPWTLIAWTPFCVAFQPLDPVPIFSRYLRTLFISLFFLLWFSPLTEPRDIILLAPPLGIMTGINYWLLVRRYGGQLHKLLTPFLWLTAAAGIAILGFYLLPPEWWTQFFPLERSLEFRHSLFAKTNGILLGTLALFIGIFLWKMYRHIPIWLTLLLLTMAPVLFYWSITRPYSDQENSKRKFALSLRNALLTDTGDRLPAVYINDIRGLYGECFYLGGKVYKLSSLRELPQDAPVVYLISPDYPESRAGRNWKNLLDKTYQEKRICLWRGELDPTTTAPEP
ncbi:glycosyltransferase family 39 protein [Victivallis sp. Marseille-Q1083]|uniref:ArnT family glycosyltransferase n=1 Tax=Victivallis sp. Marseille-Q1083 TaxID=2717288 RepID=UPI00158F2F85|nr:glycosyltransferase family 39 protein [Victivallis sp. Marseille-Q1083]